MGVDALGNSEFANEALTRLANIAREAALEREGPFKDISREPWNWSVREPEWFLDKLIPAKSIGMVYGPSNSGKSHLICDIIATLCAGERYWQGIPIAAGPVLIFSESMGHIRARMKAYMDGREVVHDLFSLPSMSLEIRNIRFLAEYIEEIGTKFSMIVFDTVSTSFCFEENDNREAAKLIQALEEQVLPLMAANGTILLAHHTSKASEGRSARGASALIGNIDYSWHVAFDKKAELTIANWEKDRWRLYMGCTRWAGEMRRVPVEFENGSADMSVLNFREWSEELENATEMLKVEAENAEKRNEIEQWLAGHLEPIFIKKGRATPSNAHQRIQKTLPGNLIGDKRDEAIQYISTLREVEEAFTAGGAFTGWIIHPNGVK